MSVSNRNSVTKTEGKVNSVKWSTDDSFVVALHNSGRVALIAKVFNAEFNTEQFINITTSTQEI